MKLIKKISSIFIALSIMLVVVGLASAASVSEEDLKTFLMQFPVGRTDDYNSSNMPTLKQYPKALNCLSELLLDLKVEEQDLDVNDQNSVATKLYQYRIKKNFLESRYRDMAIVYALVSRIADYKFLSGYEMSVDKSCYMPLHFFCFFTIVDKNGKEESRCYWIDKKECKEVAKQIMDGSFNVKDNPFFGASINNDDNDLLFIEHIQESIIKYFGDVDSFFDDDELSKKFLSTMCMVITDDGKSPMELEKIMPMISSDKAEAIKQYKQLGRDIVKRTLEYKGLEEGRDYEIEYDDATGYIKSIKKGNQNVVIIACICLGIIVIAAVVIIVVVLVKRK